ncbi:hypothetical protein OEJ37_08345 [Burkholderia sp. BKH01]|uniref:hypothetical protein n=1 Tax=Burkholderia sp. BKH01 TaxID=2769262 RepID=UPI0021E0686A|nr:hypothetical protein [Burkholderia sp. BKH01]MCU9953372.1 hypothetical protein [Burkholderia sp. BKH01]
MYSSSLGMFLQKTTMGEPTTKFRRSVLSNMRIGLPEPAWFAQRAPNDAARQKQTGPGRQRAARRLRMHGERLRQVMRRAVYWRGIARMIAVRGIALQVLQAGA